MSKRTQTPVALISQSNLIGSLVLVRQRACDGSCCKQSPRFPTPDGKDCIYHNNSGCALMHDQSLCPEGKNKIFPKETNLKVFYDTCINWPQNIEKPRIGQTGDCCWQYIEASN